MPPTRLLPSALAAASFALAASTVAVATDGAPATISVAEVRPGMRGYGLTVFRGTEPERFDVEVIDVLHNFRPDQDLVLIRTPHPRLNQTNIVAGMSGSPIYLDGRLLGAYAYGWPHGTEPVAGVTPIANMLGELRRPTRPDSFFGSQRLGELPRREPARSVAASLPLDLELPDGRLPDAFHAVRALAERTGLRAAHTAGLEPATTPLLVSGMPDEVVAVLARELSPFGLEVLQGAGGGSAAPDPTARFVDGGAIGVQMARGDISMMALGTVTHVAPDGRLAAFGHPMMEQGEVGLPTAVARIAHVMASNQRSFKVGEAVRPLGTLIHDRQSAIVIDAQRTAASVPIRIKLRGVPGIRRDEWNVTLASHRALTPMLTLGAIQTAIKSSAADQTDVSFSARTTLTIAGYGQITLDDVGALTAGPSVMNLAQLRAFSLLEVVYGNPFVESRLERVDFEIEFRYGRTQLQLIDARVLDAEVLPGERVPVVLTFRKFGEPDQQRTVEVVAPDRLAGQTVRVDVRPAPSVPRPVGRAETFQELVDYVRSAHPPTELATVIDLPGRSVAFPSHVVPDLPPSAVDALVFTHSFEGSSPFVVQDVRYHPMGAVVTGSASVELHIASSRTARSLVP